MVTHWFGCFFYLMTQPDDSDEDVNIQIDLALDAQSFINSTSQNTEMPYTQVY